MKIFDILCKMFVRNFYANMVFEWAIVEKVINTNIQLCNFNLVKFINLNTSVRHTVAKSMNSLQTYSLSIGYFGAFTYSTYIWIIGRIICFRRFY